MVWKEVKGVRRGDEGRKHTVGISGSHGNEYEDVCLFGFCSM
jgi:hypothetical protein